MKKTHSINIEQKIAEVDESATKIFGHLDAMDRATTSIRHDLAEIRADIRTTAELVDELMKADELKSTGAPADDHTVSIMVIT